MPHSVKSSSGDTASNYSFDLLRRMNSNSSTVDNNPANSNSNSNKPGVALSTSTRHSQPVHARKRSSAPPTELYANIYSDLIKTDEVDEFRFKHLGNRNSMIASYNNSAKQRTQYYEDQFQYKDNVNSSVRERVQRESPVVAELRTNVIVRLFFTLRVVSEGLTQF